MQEQAEILITLGKLLKKKRPPEIERKVNKIADSDISNEEKIRQIQEIDRKQKEEQESKKKEQIINKSKELLNSIQKPINEIKNNIKKILPSKFFSYVFKYRLKIKHFGISTKTIKSRWMSFEFDFSDEARQILISRMWDAVYNLIRPLNYIVREGWKKINKFQYNVVVHFLGFCEEFYQQDFRHVKPETFFSYSRPKNIQKLFLILAQDSIYRDEIYIALETILSNHEVFKKNVPKLIGEAKVILDPHYTKPSFYNIVLAVNMIHYRKFLTFKDLIESEGISPLIKETFISTENVKFKIKNYIEELQRRLAVLEKEKLLIDLINKTYLNQSVEEQNTTILKKIFDFKNPEMSDEKEFLFSDYEKDLIGFMDRLLSNFYYVFDSLFTDKVRIEEDGNTKILKVLPYDIINNQVYLLGVSADRVRRFISNHRFTKIYFTDYNGFLLTGKTPYETETEFFQVIIDLSDAMLNLGKETSFLVDSVNKGLTRDLTRSVPYSGKKVIGNSLLYDLTVLDFIKMLAYFCFTFAQFFQNQKIKILLSDEEKVIKDINEIKSILSRIT